MPSMRSAWCGGLGLVLGLGVVSVGCGGGAASSPPPASATSSAPDEEATADLTEHHRYHHHGGVTLFVAMSLDALGLSAEERGAVEKIRTDLQARMEPARMADQSLVAALADGLTAGNIDTAKVDAGVAQVTAAAAATHQASAAALNDLHAVLTPPQRAALVDKVEAHWAVWQKANAEETGPAKAEGGHLAMLANDLGLTADQVDKIRAALGEGMKAVPRFDPQEVANHLRAFGDAFRSESFDAKALTTASGADAHLVGWGAAHLAHFVEAASPVLTPDQRSKLAERLREHATHNPSAQANP
ncbi:MAG TPA: Spy/CpxP family protein refolding chaperone [Polyangiaceae bacterium]|nr:Spy/CpxP family protein refolding chaperone [Polyangiaceae bacterium]